MYYIHSVILLVWSLLDFKYATLSLYAKKSFKQVRVKQVDIIMNYKATILEKYREEGTPITFLCSNESLQPDYIYMYI